MGSREPIFNVPGAVLAVLAVIIAIQGVRSLLGTEQDEWLLLATAFIPARYSELGSILPGGTASLLTTPVTHMLVHGNWPHVAFNAASLLAFGGGVGLRVGGARFLWLALCCGLAGALLFWALNPGLMAAMVGASGAIAGLMGATMRYFFSALDGGGIKQLRDAPRTVPLMPLGVALRDRRVLLATGIFLLINLMAFLGVGTPESMGGIAWEAHIGGYLAGLLGFGLFDAAQTSVSQPHSKPTLH